MSRVPTMSFESQAQAIQTRMLGVRLTLDEMISGTSQVVTSSATATATSINGASRGIGAAAQAVASSVAAAAAGLEGSGGGRGVGIPLQTGVRGAATSQRRPRQSSRQEQLRQQLVDLGPLMEQFCEAQEALQKQIADAATAMNVSRIQQSLAVTLSSCEQFAAGLSAVVKRVTAGEGASDAAELDAILRSTGELLPLQTQAVGVFSEALKMRDVEEQEVFMAENADLLDERDRLMSQFIIQSRAAPTQPTRGTPTRNEKLPEVPPSYSASTPTAAPSSPSSSSSARPAAGSDDSASGGFTGWFKMLGNLPQLLRRVEPLVSPLCQAAAAGQIPQIDGLLTQGANIEGLNEDGNTALICAVRAGQVQAVAHLLDRGAKTTTKDSGDATMPPLFHATRAGHLDVMRVLLDKGGADPNLRGTFGGSFFVGAVQDPATPAAAVQLLLEKGADPNTLTPGGKPAVVAAAQRGSVEVVEVLLSRGASPTARAPSGASLLQIAVEGGNVALATVFLDRRADVNVRTPSGNAVLSVAVGNNDLAMASLLVGRGADVDVKDVSGRTPVASCVAKERDPRILKLLLDHGANLSSRDHSGKSAVTVAVSAGRFDVARILLEYGADGNDMPGWSAQVSGSPLGHCVAKDRLDGARMLLDFGADPNRADNQGQTPLLFAVKKGKTEFVQAMLDAGGNPNVRNEAGDTALTLAVKDGNVTMVRLLLDKGAMVFKGAKSAVEAARKTGRADIMQLLQSSQAGQTSLPGTPQDDAPPAYGTQ